MADLGGLMASESTLFRYYQPLEIHECPNKKPTPKTPQSSNDPCLTVFAQLGALRLNAKRGLITLSSRHAEYILAEAGQTLLLQDDDDEHDGLWHGVSTIAAEKGLGQALVKVFCDPKKAPGHVVVEDVRQDERFKHCSVVTGPPFIRFLAAVPLRAPASSVVIGNYIIVDDKPRPGLEGKEIRFMVDLALTVMDYLEAARANQKERRAQTMMKAVGLFIEGKSTLRDWWLQEGQYGTNTRVQRRSQAVKQVDGQADSEFGVQDPPDVFHPDGIDITQATNHRSVFKPLERSPSSSTISQVGVGDGRPAAPRTTSSRSTSLPMSPGTRMDHSSVTSFSTFEGPSNGTEVKHHPFAFDNPEPDESKELQEALLSDDLRTIFARASNLIREARGMDGTIFFDGSVRSFGASATRSVMEQKAPSAFSIDGVLANTEEELGSKTSDTDASANGTQSVETCCGILGYSTRNRSSLKGHVPPKESQTFPDGVLRRLLKRYPHGKVFDFEEDGSFSSSFETPWGNQNDPPKSDELGRAPRRKRAAREADAIAIRDALPGARSVFWYPLWDQSRDRWYAGSMVWSTCPSRSLCPVEDLTYLAAFGNCIMAEVARLSAQVLAQMKSDFISSISHELRSPLHGVLASVEFLQDTSMTETQIEMVDNINASGKVLLDTINHVLDFSKVNRHSKNKGRSSRKKLSRRKNSGLDTNFDPGLTENDVDLCVLSEEVVESIYSGRNATKLMSDSSAGRRRVRREQSTELGEVAVIVDIDWNPDWTLGIDAGAWTRVLMNLFSNALKYTSSGFVKVSLQLGEESAGLDQALQRVLTLQVRDSGKGISKEFLQGKLFKPFAQEDPLATGTGLGLSIVHHIVHDLGGQINFVSEIGSGTEATVRIPVSSPKKTQTNDSSALINEIRQKTSGIQASFDGFDRLPDISETPTGILSPEAEGALLLKESMKRLLTNWFSMDTTSAGTGSSGARVDILFESGIASMENKLQSYTWNISTEPILVIILCSSLPKSKIRSNEFFQIHYFQQPYTPHKVAKLLHNIFCNSNAPALPMSTLQSNVSHNSTNKPLRPSYRRDNGQHQGSDRRDFAKSAENSIPVLGPESALKQSSGVASVLGEMESEDQGDLRVLLVEDNAINLKLLVAYMRKLKLCHGTANNGLEAVAHYQESHSQKPFDVIFMDISMPIMDGIEATRHIRRHENEKGLRPCAIIALTGAANPEARQEAFSGGVDLFLTKPVPMKDLKVMLEEVRRTGRDGLLSR